MKFNVAQLLKESVGAVRRFDFEIAPDAIDDGVEAVEPVVGDLKATRTNRGILADVKLATTVKQQCSRCLGDVTSKLAGRFAEEFFPTVDLRTGASVKAPEEDVGFMLTDSHELDLLEPTRQWVLLEQPMKPLCRPDCKGLCPRCGQDLNVQKCGCVVEAADPRLSPLADWLRAHPN